MATGVGLTQISLTQLNRQTPKTPYLAQESWWYLIHKLSYSRFSDKIYQFSLPCEQGWVKRKFEWLHLIGRPPKPPFWCKLLVPISNASWVIVIFVWKFPHFRYHGNMGWFDTNFTYTVKSAVPEKPYLAQESWRYLIHKLSYSRLSDEIHLFKLPWQQRLV